MKIVADHAIPRVAAAFAALGEVELIPGREIDAARLRDCRCLVVRTHTRVDAALLENTPVEFVASPTIGTDHVDLAYLERAGIGFANAPGCNAEAAAEYVISGLFALSASRNFDPRQRRVGIVGFGNVGSRLQHKLVALGCECLVCDPPLAAAGGSTQSFVDLPTLLHECDLISLHVPLTRSGEHPTFHLLDRERLGMLGPDCILVNAARGEVIDNAALAELLRRRDDLQVFLDTWEAEPLVSRELLQRVALATPHIAGYSVEGRLRGTQMVLDASSAHFGLPTTWRMQQELPPARELVLPPAGSALEGWQTLFRQHCDIWRDHAALVGGCDLEDALFRRHFDGLRRVYPERREYENCVITQTDSRLAPEDLVELGFRVAA